MDDSLEKIEKKREIDYYNEVGKSNLRSERTL